MTRNRLTAAPASFPVTDDHLDAPDGARIFIDDYGCEYERCGSQWVRVDAPTPDARSEK